MKSPRRVRSISRRDLLILVGGMAAGSRLFSAFSAVPGRLSARNVSPSFALYYKPAHTGAVWDTWIYHHEGTFYLYILSGPFLKWDSVALATSRDGVHWEEHGNVIDAAPGVVWLGSGAVWPAGRRFIMNFSEWRGPEKGGRQTIFFAESTDLLNWKRLGPEYEFRQDTRWYESKGRWDNIWPIPREGGGLYGYWAANPKDSKVGFGFGQSADGIHWQALEPPAIISTKAPVMEDGHVVSPEVGAVHAWQGKFYAMAGGDLTDDGWGMTTLVADSPFGPFRVASGNPRLLVGNNSYFCRFVDTPQGVLVNHHSWELDHARLGDIDDDTTRMAPLKKAEWDRGGTLRLMWWKGNDRAKHRQIPIKLNAASGMRPALLDTRFDPDRTVIIEGVMRLVPGSGASPSGLFFQGSGGIGTAFLVQANGVVEYGSIRGDATQFERRGHVDRQLAPQDSVHFRLIKRGRLTEFYVSNALMQCYCLPAEDTGQVGILDPKENLTELTAWYCP